jgi:hypothetical protein
MSLVQTIVVQPSTHFDTIAAAALASGLAIVHADLGSDPWASWLGGSFTKSVRRVKCPVELERVRALGLASPGSTEISVGDAVALAFVPASYEDSPREISRLQVSGLDLAHNDADRFRQAGAVTPHIEINADVTMSTGKTAAQVFCTRAGCLVARATPQHPLGMGQRPGDQHRRGQLCRLRSSGT